MYSVSPVLLTHVCDGAIYMFICSTRLVGSLQWDQKLQLWFGWGSVSEWVTCPPFWPGPCCCCRGRAEVALSSPIGGCSGVVWECGGVFLSQRKGQELHFLQCSRSFSTFFICLCDTIKLVWRSSWDENFPSNGGGWAVWWASGRERGVRAGVLEAGGCDMLIRWGGCWPETLLLKDMDFKSWITQGCFVQNNAIAK